ncbi:hypothetical protein ACKLNQ_00980 [Myroides odoratimimus]|uniref:hypothetical protein n=1 Tax=Myroides odoratimimus TaxID=76832 RepID=UPI0038D3606B
MGLFDFIKKKPSLITNLEVCNYAEIYSNEVAEQYCKAGHLEKLYLIGLAFGGDDSPFNILYAPKEAVLKKEQIDKELEDLLNQGLHIQYRAFPEYKGNSFIPSKVIIEVDGDQTFTKEIEIW